MRERSFYSGLMAATALAATFNPALAEEPSMEAEKPPVEDIVVTASPIAGAKDRFATIVGETNRDDILKNGGATLADALGTMPGVTGTGFAAGASRPVIRGFDATRVKILEGGIGSFDVSELGPDHGVPIDPLAILKVEVVRGAGTLRYGSQAIGGVVNAINNRVPLALGDEPFSGEISGSWGSSADAGQGSALLDATVGSMAFHADGFYRHTDDYKTPGGTMANSYFEGGGFSGGTSYFFGDSRIGGAIVHYDTEYGIPGEEAYIDMKQTKGLFGSSFAVDSGLLKTVTVDAGYADYTHSEIEQETGEVGATFNNQEWDSRAEFLFDGFGPFSAAAAGLQYQHRNYSALGEAEEFLLPTVSKNAALFLFGEVPVGDRFNLELGGRVERVDVSGTPASDVPTELDFTPLSGSAGLLFRASDTVKIGLTAASAARAPVQTELFARGPHEATQTFETGDPTLGLERSNSLEATLRYKADRVEFEGAAWVADFNNYIFGRLTGNSCNEEGECVPGDGEELQELFYEANDATFRGLEGKLTFKLMAGEDGTLDALLLADYVRATLKGGENVPRIPPYHLGGGLSWESDRIDAGFLVKYSGEQDDVPEGDSATDDFVSLDAQVAVRPFRSMPGLELALVGRNLTNSEQHNATALNRDEVTLPGRDIRLMLRASF